MQDELKCQRVTVALTAARERETIKCRTLCVKTKSDFIIFRQLERFHQLLTAILSSCKKAYIYFALEK